jgi:hypothetical protein
MAIKGRTQLSIHITDEHYNAFNQIKEETGLSNAKIVEMLIDSYVSSPKKPKIGLPTTSAKPLTTSTTKPEPKYVTEERVKELIQEALSSYTTTQKKQRKKKKRKKWQHLSHNTRMKMETSIQKLPVPVLIPHRLFQNGMNKHG